MEQHIRAFLLQEMVITSFCPLYAPGGGGPVKRSIRELLATYTTFDAFVDSVVARAAAEFRKHEDDVRRLFSTDDFEALDLTEDEFLEERAAVLQELCDTFLMPSMNNAHLDHREEAVERLEAFVSTLVRSA
jgi:hypothetical protein